jgi:hypothetical protein
MILYNAVRSLNRGKYLFPFQEVFTEIVEFLQYQSDFPPQLKDYLWLFDHAFLPYLNPKQNYFNTKLIIDTN